MFTVSCRHRPWGFGDDSRQCLGLLLRTLDEHNKLGVLIIHLEGSDEVVFRTPEAET